MNIEKKILHEMLVTQLNYTANGLCQKLFIERHSICACLRSMEKRNLIIKKFQKKNRDTNRRVWVYGLTDTFIMYFENLKQTIP